MLGLLDHVALPEVTREQQMETLAVPVGHALVDALQDHLMRELVGIDVQAAHEAQPRRPLQGSIDIPPQQLAQPVKGEPLAHDRRQAQCIEVPMAELIELALHQMLHAGGQGRIGMQPEKLRQEQRIALGPLHVQGGVGRIDVGELLAQGQGLVTPQRSQFDQRQRHIRQ